jgi:hypothetical protein
MQRFTDFPIFKYPLDGHRLQHGLIFVPIQHLYVPKPNTVAIEQNWWVVNNFNEVVFSRHYTSPKCSPSKSLAKYYIKTLPNPHTHDVIYVETAHIPKTHLEQP